MEDMLWACAFVLTCMGFYHFVWPRLKRFDQNNVARIAQQDRDKADANAHFRHALEVADEQVEAVQEIKVAGGVQYLFEAQVFATRDEAEDMRARRVGVVARRFYDELPTALMTPSEPRSPLSARERASKRWKRTIH
ncbi:MAG: hypothetical protein V4601_14095 [Pseudomonadota bacterium]